MYVHEISGRRTLEAVFRLWKNDVLEFKKECLLEVMLNQYMMHSKYGIAVFKKWRGVVHKQKRCMDA